MVRHQANDAVSKFSQPHSQASQPQQSVYSKCQCIGNISGPHVKGEINHSSRQSLEKSCYIRMGDLVEQQRAVKLILPAKNSSLEELTQIKKSMPQSQLKQDIYNSCKPSKYVCSSFLQQPTNQRTESSGGQEFHSTIVHYQELPSGISSQTKIVLSDAQNMKREFLELNAPLEPPRLKEESKESKKFSKLQWFYISLAWFITALGIGIYLYILFIAFCGDNTFLSKTSVLIVITVMSNVCLLSAVYFHQKIRKYFNLS